MYLIRYILLKIESLLVEKNVSKWHLRKHLFRKLFLVQFRMLLKRGKGNEERVAGNGHVERDNEKWEQGRVLQLKSLIGQGFNLSFAPDFLFPVYCARSQLPFLV